MKKMNKACLLSAACALCVGFGVFGGAMLTANAETQNDKAVFFVQDGASVKLMENANDSGIRFNFMVKKDYFNTIDFSAMKINAKIIPTALLSEVTSDALIAEESAQYSEIAAENWNAYKDEQGGEWMTSYAYLYGLPSEAYDYDISAVGYITSGNEIVYKTDVATRTMAYVASAALYDEEETWTAEQQTVLGAYLANYDYELALTAQSNELLKAATADDEDTDCPEITLVTDTKAPVPVTYSSANEEIATADENGKVTAVAAGKTTITATTAKTTTDEQETATYEVTVYNYHEVETPEDFFAMKTNDSTVYYALTKDVDFAKDSKGNEVIVNNITPETPYYSIGYTGSIDTVSPFKGVFDGNGKKITNITLNGINGNAIKACLFYQTDSAVLRNVYAQMKLNTALAAKSAKEVGFVYTATLSTIIQNCYIELETDQEAYGTHTPVVAVVAYTSNGGVKIRNTIGVLKFTDVIKSQANGGYAALLGRANTNEAYLENSYGVVVSKDNVKPAKLNCDSTYNSAYKAVVVTNSTAHNSLAEVYASISQEGVLKNNGWGNVWSIKNNTLYFGEAAVYTATNA